MDLSPCDSIPIRMPLKGTVDETKEPYYQLLKRGVNIYNSSDPFYTNRCFKFQINGTDIPVNTRRQFLFPNSTALCGENCKVVGIDPVTTYLNCECQNPSLCTTGNFIQDFKSSIIGAIGTSNLLILECSVIYFIK